MSLQIRVAALSATVGALAAAALFGLLSGPAAVAVPTPAPQVANSADFVWPAPGGVHPVDFVWPAGAPTPPPAPIANLAPAA
ncbi:hypothetical protein ABT095_23600 [Kitasatospora sp. NPDC002227]|uniref:hypothetical protein n=1 Tax=Kitasatospora sp. NPDC002227 TaxID=3154773 RepID=UPI00332DAA68